MSCENELMMQGFLGQYYLHWDATTVMYANFSII